MPHDRPELRGDGVLNGGALSDDGALAALFCSSATGERGWPDLHGTTDFLSGNIHVFDAATGRRPISPMTTTAEPLGGTFDPSGAILVAVLVDGSIVAIQIASGETHQIGTMSGRLGISNTQRQRARYSPDGETLLTWGHGKGVHVWDPSNWTRRTMLAPDDTVIDAHFSSDGSRVATASGSGRVQVWTVSDGAAVGPVLEHSDRTFRARFDPEGELLLTACRDHFARLWRWRDGELALAPLDHGDEVFDIGFSDDGSTLFTYGGWSSSSLQIWSARDGQPLVPAMTLPQRGYHLGLSAKGGAIVGGSEGISIIDLARLLEAPAEESVASLLLRAELHSGYRIHPSGVHMALTADEWLERWELYLEER